MKISKVFKPFVTGFLCTVFLAGFTGKEKYVELEGYVNGRNSSSFTTRDKNIVSVLEKGTRGEIVEYKKLASGNYGLRVKVLNGSEMGQYVWVYHRTSNSDLALYETIPSNWKPSSSDSPTQTRPQEQPQQDVRIIPTPVVENARGVETIRETQAIRRPAPPSIEMVKASFGLIPQANRQVRRGVETACADCSLPTVGNDSLIRDPSRYEMDPKCGRIFDELRRSTRCWRPECFQYHDGTTIFLSFHTLKRFRLLLS